MRRMVVALLFLPAAVTLSCTSVVPPRVPAPARDTFVRAPFDMAWLRTLAFFSDNRIPIATIEKASGLLAARTVTLSSEQIRRWADCGMMGDKRTVDRIEPGMIRATADMTVLAHGAGDSTAFRITVNVEGQTVSLASGGKFGPQACVSSGGFEHALLTAVGTAP